MLLLFAQPLFLCSQFSSKILSIFSASLYFYLKLTQICIIFRCQRAIRNAQFIQHPLIVSLHYHSIKILLQFLHFSILTCLSNFQFLDIQLASLWIFFIIIILSLVYICTYFFPFNSSSSVSHLQPSPFTCSPSHISLFRNSTM